jgi:hypothetical protein
MLEKKNERVLFEFYLWWNRIVLGDPRGGRWFFHWNVRTQTKKVTFSRSERFRRWDIDVPTKK